MQQRQRCLPDGSSVKREFQALFCEKPEVQSLRLTLPICARLHHSGDLFYAKVANSPPTGFQGGLQWYGCTTGKYTAELETLSGRTIDVPACFIAGKSDWAVYYTPGALERMQTTACTRWRGTHLVEDAGHWVGEEQPEQVARLLLEFLSR